MRVRAAHLEDLGALDQRHVHGSHDLGHLHTRAPRPVREQTVRCTTATAPPELSMSDCGTRHVCVRVRARSGRTRGRKGGGTLGVVCTGAIGSRTAVLRAVCGGGGGSGGAHARMLLPCACVCVRVCVCVSPHAALPGTRVRSGGPRSKPKPASSKALAARAAWPGRQWRTWRGVPALGALRRARATVAAGASPRSAGDPYCCSMIL
jgi:hypothetical protein